uniref:uncharacterized protein LOC122605924 isoform X1 n=1 Tax=Erigeron canadensis TaxID=72917 RepID=UPI001CB96F75|nr:uncharacterized protein LOC122605924 isoform X1 [Erigeron canadensis]
MILRNNNRMMKPRISFILTVLLLYKTASVVSVVVPATSCYVLDNSSHIHDFSNWIGKEFEYDGAGTDFAVRFCTDVESRSNLGYVGFGRFDAFHYFAAGSGQYDFVQEFYNGDLRLCEKTHDKRGRTAQLNIICGDCPNARCKGGLECVCNVTFESDCRIIVELAIACEKPGARVFEGFTVGFHPRSWEIVYNGMTQYGYEKAYMDYSFDTDQSRLSLYMTAISSISQLVTIPTITVSPDTGLEVTLSGSAATGSPPTTLSPTLLNIDWRCERAHDSPYEVQVTIPVDGYDPVKFTLTKMCKFKQSESGNSTKGWAIFGIISCIFFAISTLFCCGGFIYKIQVQKQHGIDALPGMTILSACLETVSGAGGVSAYMQPNDFNDVYASHASWTRDSVASPGSSKTSERRYGT